MAKSLTGWMVFCSYNLPAEPQLLHVVVSKKVSEQPLTRPPFRCTPPLPLVGVSIAMERGCQQNDRTLVSGYQRRSAHTQSVSNHEDCH